MLKSDNSLRNRLNDVWDGMEMVYLKLRLGDQTILAVDITYDLII